MRNTLFHLSSDTAAGAQRQMFNLYSTAALARVLHYNANSSTEHCGRRETTVILRHTKWNFL